MLVLFLFAAFTQSLRCSYGLDKAKKPPPKKRGSKTAAARQTCRVWTMRMQSVESSTQRRQLLRVEAPFGPDEIAARLGRVESADLILDPVEVDREGRRLRVLAQWFPPAPVEEEALDGAASPASAAPRR